MIVFVFMLIGTTGAAYLVHKLKGSAADSDDYCGGCAGGLFLGLFIGALLQFIFTAALPEKYNVTTWEYRDRVSLAALDNVTGIHGDPTFLGSGPIDSRFYYVYNYLTSRGGKRFGKVNMDHSEVFEEDREDGFLVNLHKVIRPSAEYKNSFWDWASTTPNKDEFIITDIYVPKGSVKKGINIDLAKLK
jgi:hypothetical protein